MNIFKKLSVLCGLTAMLGMTPLAFSQDAAAPAEDATAPVQDAAAPAEDASAAPVAAEAVPAPRAPVNGDFGDDWKITVNGKAKSAGAISFRVVFAPSYDGSPGPEKFVDALVPEGTGENDVADIISNAFKTILGEDDLKIKVSWGENIKVKAEGETPDFVVEIVSNSVQGVSVEIQD
jgi:hypothetical protein